MAWTAKWGKSTLISEIKAQVLNFQKVLQKALKEGRRIKQSKHCEYANQDKYISKVKLATVVEGDQKAPFSIATTLWCKGGCYAFPWIAPLYSQYVPYIAEC